MPIEVGELKFYTVEDLAKKFKVSTATIYGYIRSGRLSAQRFGRNYQILESSLEKFFTDIRNGK